MKKLSKKSAERMINALNCALYLVRRGEFYGLCAGIEIAAHRGVCADNEADYLRRWIKDMLNSSNMFLEGYLGNKMGTARGEGRYELRKPWVEWMIKHLEETT